MDVIHEMQPSLLFSDKLSRHVPVEEPVVGTSVSRLPPQLPEDEGKLTVVLDIDETLIHTEQAGLFNPVVGNVGDCFYLNMEGVQLRVRKRPFLDEFLRIASQKFELIAFTAGAEDYATAILDHLDPDRTIFRHRLFRQHCVAIGHGPSFIKDLRIVNRCLSRTVLVDNNVHSFLFQLGNGIPIASFFDNVMDKALVGLHTFLEEIRREEDVRLTLQKVFNLRLPYGGYLATSF